jgi:hypothetical protein
LENGFNEETARSLYAQGEAVVIFALMQKRTPQNTKRLDLLHNLKICILMGLWTIDGKSGEFTQLSNDSFVRVRGNGEILADGDTYLFGWEGLSPGLGVESSRPYSMIDLRDGTVTPIATTRRSFGLTEFCGYVQQFTIQDGWAWGIMKINPEDEFHFMRFKIGQPTASANLILRIQPFEFYSCVFGNELPIDSIS